MDLETKNGRQTKHGGGRAYRSRLELFVELIRQQRQQRRTWQEIAAQLREKDCAITFQGLHQFYRRYLKRQSRPHWETEAAVAQPATAKLQTPAHKPMLAATPNARPFRQPSPENINLNDPTKI
jgi:predicted metal-dependent phosphoesterase TrpH